MSIIAHPAGLICGQFGFSQHRYDLSEMSDSTGAAKTRLMGPPRWGLSIASGNILSLAQASIWEALVLRLRGGVNHFAAYDIVRVAPRGTARGTLTLNAIAAAGATTIVLNSSPSQVGNTLLQGDWLQIGTGLGSHLCKVVTDVTFAGATASVVIEPPLRVAFASTTAVTWDKPLGHYKMVTEAPAWNYASGSNTLSGFALDLLEQWA